MRKILFFLVAVMLSAASLAAAPGNEIDALLQYIGGLDGASFVRNGSAHSATEAEAHLRLKWNNQKSGIATAEDFIRLCGTGSSMSGKPYLIRFKDGREEASAQVLLKQLKVIRGKPTASNKPVRGAMAAAREA